MNQTVMEAAKKASTWVAGGAILLGALAVGMSTGRGANDTARPAPRLNLDNRPIDRGGRHASSFAPVVKKVSPSVVQVTIERKAVNPWHSDGLGEAERFFPWFFGPRGGPGGRRGGAVPREQGMGSGVIVTADGYILTNNHVVDGADEVKITVQDGRDFKAKVIGKDPKSDVAVVKIDAKDLPAIELANSENLEVGDLVLAVGNPYGIGQTVTMGMVSAKGRGNMGLDYEDFIQTDAAINPGNSGGALVDSEGRLVGVNTAILSRTGGSVGIGFAIPSNLARAVMESLIADGRVTRGYLGVLIQDVTPALAQKFELKEAKGVLVGDVTPKGPAEKAGLKSGDVVVEFNGQAVQDSRQFKLLVAQARPGSEATLKVLREGASKRLAATLKELPGTERLARADAPAVKDEGTLNGVGVSDLDPRTRRELDAPANLRGALVTEVEPGSPAQEAGLRVGDVILEIDKQAVRDADEAVKLTERSTRDKTTLLRVWREGNTRYVVVDENKAG